MSASDVSGIGGPKRRHANADDSSTCRPSNPGTIPSGNVSDSVADLDTYSYTLQYTTPQGNAGTYDPTIKNER